MWPVWARPAWPTVQYKKLSQRSFFGRIEDTINKLLSRFTDLYFVFHCFHQCYQPNSSRVRVKPRFCSVSVKFSPSRKSPISSSVAPRISFKRITLKKISNRNNQESPFKSEIYKCCTCCENCDVIRYLEITVSIAIYYSYSCSI